MAQPERDEGLRRQGDGVGAAELSVFEDIVPELGHAHPVVRPDIVFDVKVTVIDARVNRIFDERRFAPVQKKERFWIRGLCLPYAIVNGLPYGGAPWKYAGGDDQMLA